MGLVLATATLRQITGEHCRKLYCESRRSFDDPPLVLRVETSVRRKRPDKAGEGPSLQLCCDGTMSDRYVVRPISSASRFALARGALRTSQFTSVTRTRQARCPRRELRACALAVWIQIAAVAILSDNTLRSLRFFSRVSLFRFPRLRCELNEAA